MLPKAGGDDGIAVQSAPVAALPQPLQLPPSVMAGSVTSLVMLGEDYVANRALLVNSGQFSRVYKGHSAKVVYST